MIEMEILLGVMTTTYPMLRDVLTFLGCLVVLGQSYVAITPNKKDDAWFARLEEIPMIGEILRALVSFAPVQRKDR